MKNFFFDQFPKSIELEHNLKSINAYIQLNTTIEQIASVADIIMVKLLLIGVTGPVLLLSYVSYYIYDQGDESFYLPFPVWCVFFYFSIFLDCKDSEIKLGLSDLSDLRDFVSNSHSFFKRNLHQSEFFQ